MNNRTKTAGPKCIQKQLQTYLQLQTGPTVFRAEFYYSKKTVLMIINCHYLVFIDVLWPTMVSS